MRPFTLVISALLPHPYGPDNRHQKNNRSQFEGDQVLGEEDRRECLSVSWQVRELGGGRGELSLDEQGDQFRGWRLVVVGEALVDLVGQR